MKFRLPFKRKKKILIVYYFKQDGEIKKLEFENYEEIRKTNKIQIEGKEYIVPNERIYEINGQPTIYIYEWKKEAEKIDEFKLYKITEEKEKKKGWAQVLFIDGQVIRRKKIKMKELEKALRDGFLIIENNVYKVTEDSVFLLNGQATIIIINNIPVALSKSSLEFVKLKRNEEEDIIVPLMKIDALRIKGRNIYLTGKQHGFEEAKRVYDLIKLVFTMLMVLIGIIVGVYLLSNALQNLKPSYSCKCVCPINSVKNITNKTNNINKTIKL